MYSDEHQKELAENDVPVDRLPRFVEAPGFAGVWSRCGLGDADLHVLQASIAARPTMGSVIPGTSGVRKARFAPPGAGRGKSGAFRVFYLLALEHSVVFLIAILSKKQRESLTKAERDAVAGLAAALKAELSDGRDHEGKRQT